MDVLEAFTAEVRRPDEELRLDRAALLIAAGEYPDLSMEHHLGLLDGIAERARAIAPPAPSARALAQAVRRHLYDDLGFRGNAENYYDPRNSYLNQVLQRRTGIPISLAVVFIEVARRAGLEASGVSYPRHFLVKYQDDGQEWILDPFAGGEELPGEQFRALLLEQAAAPEHVVDYHLAAVTRRQMLTRMLTNLKGVYTTGRDYARALRVQEFMLALTPWSLEEIRDRGVLRSRMGDVPGALADLETYLEHADAAGDTVATRRLVDQLRAARPLDEQA